MTTLVDGQLVEMRPHFDQPTAEHPAVESKGDLP